MSKSRNKIFARGISEVEFRQVEPTSETSFTSFGYCKDITLVVESELTNIKDVTGNTTLLLKEGEEISVEFTLLQTSKDEVDLVRDIGNKVYSLRINGAVSNDTAHYLYIENIMFEPNFQVIYSSGERVIQLKGVIVKDNTLNYDVPLYILTETKNVIDLSKCKFYFDGINKLNKPTTKVLDISGYRKHGDLSTSASWIVSNNLDNVRFVSSQNMTTPFIDLSGGNLLFEFWINSNYTLGDFDLLNQVLGMAGFQLIFQHEAILNNSTFLLSTQNGTNTNEATYSASDFQGFSGQWKHICFFVDVVDKSNSKMFVNSVSRTPTGNAVNGFLNANTNLIIGENGTFSGGAYFHISKLRLYAGISTASVNSFVTNNFNTEKSIYGL